MLGEYINYEELDDDDYKYMYCKFILYFSQTYDLT